MLKSISDPVDKPANCNGNYDLARMFLRDKSDHGTLKEIALIA